MPTAAELATWPFLSIVAWPPAWERRQVAALLAEAGGLDQATLTMRLGQQPPMVLKRVDPSPAAQMIRDLVVSGGDGFLFTLDDLAALGPTLGISDLSVTEGAIDVQLRAGPHTRLRFDTIQVLVRAQLARTVTHRREPLRPNVRIGRRRSWDSIKAEVESSVTREIETSDKLDLHTTDGSVYQVDGDRFAYQALGALRSHGDKANMDSMCDLLSHLCPDAVVDTWYKLWRPPPGHDKLVVPNMTAARDDPTFAFYSRWAALTYRHILTG